MATKKTSGNVLSQIEKKKRPQTALQKRKTRETFPEECFLAPKERKYLVCDKKKKLDCDLIKTSYIHAKTWSKKKPKEIVHKKAVKSAIKKAKEEDCKWFGGAPFPGTKRKSVKKVSPVPKKRIKRSD